MQVKSFEIRDAGTFIPAICVKLDPLSGPEADRYLIRRSGWVSEPGYVLTKMTGGDARYDVYDWDNRTMQRAHDYIARNWDSLESGAVVDVEFIMGDSLVPKQSEAVS